jgi:hypothetical protein
MKSKTRILAMIVSVMFFFTYTTYGQHNSSDVYWHVDPSVKTCSMVIDPSLTQGQWKRYTRQVGEIASFKSMASAETIGKKHFSIAIEYSMTPVDQHDPAWINTFAHPDDDCPLGDQIKMPMLRAKFGVTDKIDIGAIWTKAPGANYGMIGGDLKYAFLEESKKMPSAAIRASFIALTGVPDYNISISSIDLLVSKKFAGISPYLGIKESLIMGTETTSKVDLDKENLLATQGFIGVTYTIWRINLAMEYTISNVNTFSFLIGFQTFKNKK